MKLLYVGSAQGLDILGRPVKYQFVTSATKLVINLEVVGLKIFGERIQVRIV